MDLRPALLAAFNVLLFYSREQFNEDEKGGGQALDPTVPSTAELEAGAKNLEGCLRGSIGARLQCPRLLRSLTAARREHSQNASRCSVLL